MTITNERTLQPTFGAAEFPPEKLRDNLRHLDRRQWWLWSTTTALILLLTVAVASFAFPALLSLEQNTYSFYLNQAVRALNEMALNEGRGGISQAAHLTEPILGLLDELRLTLDANRRALGYDREG